MITALKLIASKSSDAMDQALRAIQSTNDQVRQMRYNMVAHIALNDRNANFTEDEKLKIIGLINDYQTKNRDYTLRIRLTPDEQNLLQTESDELGMTMSEFARRKIFPGR